MKIELTTNYVLITDILNTPELLKLTDPDTMKAEFDPREKYLLVTDPGAVGLIRLHPMTHVTAIGHIHLLPQVHGTGKSVEAVMETKEYIKKNLTYKSIITTVPMECEHVIKLMNKTGFTPCGVINQGIVFNHKLQDLILFQTEV